MIRKALLFILLTCFSGSVFAQSGVFFDSQATGEGIIVTQNVFATSMYLFTYGGERCVEEDIVALSLDPDCDHDGQLWYFSSDKLSDGAVKGLLYAAVGNNFPVGVQDPDDPFVWHLAKTFPVAGYEMSPAGTGWVLDIVHFDESPLDEDDVLFRSYDFVDLIAAPD
jgi:hypothetical protein